MATQNAQSQQEAITANTSTEAGNGQAFVKLTDLEGLFTKYVLPLNSGLTELK